MGKAKSASFKISSALKTILGKELITDPHIAIFELVKNSFDADASRVDITIDTLNKKGSRIVIKDNGNGMSEEDIYNKWLFVAYSSKKDGEDYRNRLKTNKAYAGAKGVGRFSCDRLGSKLSIYTKTKPKDKLINSLSIDWDEFEKDQAQEFGTIKTRYQKLNEAPYKFSKGTVLEITDLRLDEWQRENLVALRRKLERLVNPNPENSRVGFSIYLHAPQEKSKDAKVKEVHEKVNGKVENTIFEILKSKTAQLVSYISDSGETIITKLVDRGVKIFEIEEKNPYRENDDEIILHGISLHLYHMNRSARVTFTKHMGLPIQDYGSIFLYKNNFRVHPFGDPGDDRLGISERQTQGMFRRLGTRDLTGRIEIHGSNPELKETSSRDGGLISTPAYLALKNYLIDFGLKRLEKYVIEFAKFGIRNIEGYEKGQLPNTDQISTPEFQDFLLKWTKALTNSKEVIRFEYDPETIDVLKTQEAKNAKGIIKNFERIAEEQGDKTLLREAKKAEKHLSDLLNAKEEAEKDAETWEEIATSEHDRANQEETKRKTVEEESLFLTSLLARKDESTASHHLIRQELDGIVTSASSLLRAIEKSQLETPSNWKERLSNLIIHARKAETLAMFAIHADFKAESDERNGDIVVYIEQYLERVLGSMSPASYGPQIPIVFNNTESVSFVTRYLPIKLTIILDNLISNSVKNRAKSISVAIQGVDDRSMEIHFMDDGGGIPKENFKKVFTAGFSTTKLGTGLGLHHVRKFTKELGGKVHLAEGSENGAHFILTINK